MRFAYGGDEKQPFSYSAADDATSLEDAAIALATMTSHEYFRAELEAGDGHCLCDRCLASLVEWYRCMRSAPEWYLDMPTAP